MARHLLSLQQLSAYEDTLGLEGVCAVANSLTKLETLSINNNEQVRQGVSPLGRLWILHKLFACTCDSMQRGLD